MGELAYWHLPKVAAEATHKRPMGIMTLTTRRGAFPEPNPLFRAQGRSGNFPFLGHKGQRRPFLSFRVPFRVPFPLLAKGGLRSAFPSKRGSVPGSLRRGFRAGFSTKGAPFRILKTIIQTKIVACSADADTPDPSSSSSSRPTGGGSQGTQSPHCFARGLSAR